MNGDAPPTPEPPLESPAWAERLGVLTFDDFLPDPAAMRASALQASYVQPGNPQAGPAARCSCSSEICDGFEATLAHRLDRAVRINLANFRHTTATAAKALVCHTDWDLGDATAVLYLTLPEHCRGGTAFFRHHATADVELVPARAHDYDYRDPAAWDRLLAIPMAFNRCVVFPAPRFHSVIPPLFGSSIADGRLTLVAWFNFGTQQSDYVAGLPR